MEQQLKALLERTLIATQKLAQEAVVADTKFLLVLLGIYRISFTTLRDIDHLVAEEGAGPSILDLTRKIIEHGVSIEYMLWKGKEEMAGRFQEYLTVQMHEELELLKSIGVDPTTLSTELQIGIDGTEKKYVALPADTKKDRTWAGLSFEGMLQALTTAGVIQATDSPRLLSAYVWGCRSNHPNPFMTHAYLNLGELQAANTFSSRLGIGMSLAIHIRLTTRFIDESRLAVGSNIYPEIAADIAAIQNDLNSLR
jgi:hypothetical protein